MSIALPAVEVRLSVRDGRGARGFMLAHRAPATIAADSAAMVALASTVQGVSDCSYVSGSLTYKYYVGDGPTSGNQPSFYNAIFLFRTSIEDQWVILDVPGIKPSLIAAIPGRELLLDDTLVLNIADHIISGGFTNPFGHAATQFMGAYVQYLP